MTTDGDLDSDSTAAVVLGQDGRTCAILTSKDKPEDFWSNLAMLGLWYNQALLNGELNQGGGLLYFMRQCQYPNILIHPYPTNRPVIDRMWTRVGPSNRKPLLQQLRAMWRFDPSLCKSDLLYSEAVSFVINKAGKPGAASGFHDDILFGACHADHGRRVHLGLIYDVEEAPPVVVEEQPIRYPEDGITVFDLDDEWLATQM